MKENINFKILTVVSWGKKKELKKLVRLLCSNMVVVKKEMWTHFLLFFFIFSLFKRRSGGSNVWKDAGKFHAEMRTNCLYLMLELKLWCHNFLLLLSNKDSTILVISRLKNTIKGKNNNKSFSFRFLNR